MEKTAWFCWRTAIPAIHIESEARQVFDVSGAGDTVIALLGLGLAAGASFEDSAKIANAAAGIVVAKVGTATASLDELKQALVLSAL